MIGLLLFLVVGLAAGWLAGKIMGKGFGLIGNLVIGVIGAFLGSFLYNKITSSAVAWGEFSLMGLVATFCLRVVFRRPQVASSREPPRPCAARRPGRSVAGGVHGSWPSPARLSNSLFFNGPSTSLGVARRRYWMSSAQILTAISGTVIAPIGSPTGVRTRSISSCGTPVSRISLKIILVFRLLPIRPM